MSKSKGTYDSAVLRLSQNERAAALAKLDDPAEAARRALANHERVIESAVRSFVDLGRALLAIRTERLYAEEFSTFSDYCDARWDISETHANRVINAALVAIEATPIGVEINSEAVARELVGLDREQIREVWDEATRRVAGGRVTAALVKEVRKALEHPTIDGEAHETPPDAAVPEDGEEGAAATGGPAVPSEPPIEEPTDEESDPMPRVASPAPSDAPRVASVGAPAEQEEPASSPPADERPQAEAGVTQPAAAPQQSPSLAAALDSPEARAAALRRDLHGFMEAGWKVIDQIDPGEIAPSLKPQVIEDVANFHRAIDGWLAAIGAEHRQYTRPRLVKEA